MEIPKTENLNGLAKKDSSISEANFTTDLMREPLTKMKASNHYRQLVFFIETCYSESVMSAAVGFPSHGHLS